MVKNTYKKLPPENPAASNEQTVKAGITMLDEKNYRVDANFRWLGSCMKETEELCLTVCGIERCRPDKTFGPIIRDDYHVHMVLHGKGYLKMNGKTYTVTDGQIFTTFPDVEVYYYSDPKDPWYYTWISFGGIRAAYFLEKAGITLEHPVRDAYMDSGAFLNIAEKILNHHELIIENELLRTSFLYEAIALLVKSYSEQHPRKNLNSYPSDVYVNSALDYIHRNYARIQVSDVAKHIGISRYYLSRIFKNKMNISPQTYLLNYRLEQAGNLLRTTNMTVQEISDEVGYTNSFSFSESFKKLYGFSPKKYRDHLKKEKPEA